MTQKKGKDNPFVVDYVLPDFTTIRRGYVRPKDEAGSGEQVPTHFLLKFVLYSLFLAQLMFTFRLGIGYQNE